MTLSKSTVRLVIGLAVVLAGLTTSAQDKPGLIVIPPEPLGMSVAERPTVAVPVVTPVPELDTAKVETVVERYPNGNVKVERCVIQNEEASYVNHGPYTIYDLDGEVLKKGEFQNGRQHGKWTQYFAEDEGHLISSEQQKEFTGPFVSEATFVDGKLQGTWTIKDRSGQRIIEWSFYHGDRSGKWTWWHSNGQKWLEATYKNGALDGELLEWDRDGKLVAQSTYVDGRYLAKEVGWYELGHKHFEGNYLRVSTVPEPVYDWWNGTASVPSPPETGEDQKHGVWISWYRNGNRKFQGEYDHDLPTGKFVWWYENGQKQSEGEYERGQKCGIWVTLHPNGLKESQVTYINGKRIGTWMQWDANGKVVGMRDYDDNGRPKEVPVSRAKTAQQPSNKTTGRPSTKYQRPSNKTTQQPSRTSRTR